MKPAVYTLSVPADAAASTTAGFFVAATLLSVLLYFPVAATGAVYVRLIRDGKTMAIGATSVIGATEVRVSFPVPVVLQGSDQISVDTSATAKAATAWVEYQP
jgi:hypothetical protein